MGARRAFNPTHVPTPEQLDRESQVLQLRQSGATFDAIAQQVGIADRGMAHKIYKRALARVHAPEVTELRKLEGERLDELQLAIYSKALRGDIKAVQEVRRLMERRARLYGLDHADGIAERTLQLEQDKVRLIALALFRVFDELGLDEEQRAVGTRILMAELRAAEQDDDQDPTPDDGESEVVDGQVDGEAS